MLHTHMHKRDMIRGPRTIVTNVPKLLKAMAELIPERDKQGVLASKLGTDQPQISRWMAGKQNPLGVNLEGILALAREMGVIGDVRSEDVAEDLRQMPVRRMVKLKGYVGAGSVAHFYALADEDFEEVPAPAEATDQTIAVEIKGSSWGPRMNTWLVFYDDVRSPVTPDLIGETCVVGLADDRILIKEIQRNGRGGFRLLSNSPTEDEIDDAEIEWAAKVTSMRPR